jgi:hypothetical protein
MYFKDAFRTGTGYCVTLVLFFLLYCFFFVSLELYLKNLIKNVSETAIRTPSSTITQFKLANYTVLTLKMP